MDLTEWSCHISSFFMDHKLLYTLMDLTEYKLIFFYCQQIASGPLFFPFWEIGGEGRWDSNYKHGACHYHYSIFTWFLIPFIVIVQVIAAITYQIVPADTQHVEIPLLLLLVQFTITRSFFSFHLLSPFHLPTHTLIILSHQWVYKQRERPYGLWYGSMDELLFGIYTNLFICIC